MKRIQTHFLRLAIVVFGAAVLALCIFALPSMWKGGSVEFPIASYAVKLIVIGLYATVVPFFIALWHAFKLLGHIDRGNAFSELSVKALSSIKHCAAVIAVLYVGGYPLIYPIADADDAPGLIIVAGVIVCAHVALAVFLTILERLLREVVEGKLDNSKAL